MQHDVKTSDLELVNLVRSLVNLFPKEHPKCRQWLKENATQPSVLREPDPRSTGSRKRVGTQHIPQSNPANKNPIPPSKSVTRPQTPPAFVKPLRQAAPVPAFAREIQKSPNDWQSNMVAGKQLSWDEEKNLYAEIQNRTGLRDAAQGHLGGMLLLRREQTTSSGKRLIIEVGIPRSRDHRILLIILQIENGPPRQFETSLADSTASNIQKLVQFVEHE